jgi:hypothetical protein
MLSKIAGVAGAGLIALGGVVMTAMPATAAETNPYCRDSVQIGSTGYITVNGQTAASVKQYKGCGQNYGYVYVWDGFRSSHSKYEICAAVRVSGEARQGVQCSDARTNTQEKWSLGTRTLDDCTRADGTLSFGSTEVSGRSSERC